MAMNPSLSSHNNRSLAQGSCFCDIVGFTTFAKAHTPEQLVSLLNELISRFDALTASLSLEKIKTIGDCYLVVAGLPEKRNDHAKVIAQMALGMIEAVNEFNAVHGQNFKVRIGIHSGPVIGGVIGKKKFTFNIWGDAVNIASRLESHGIPGKIQISQDTYELIKNDFFLKNAESLRLKTEA